MRGEQRGKERERERERDRQRLREMERSESAGGGLSFICVCPTRWPNCGVARLARVWGGWVGVRDACAAADGKDDHARVCVLTTTRLLTAAMTHYIYIYISHSFFISRAFYFLPALHYIDAHRLSRSALPINGHRCRCRASNTKTMQAVHPWTSLHFQLARVHSRSAPSSIVYQSSGRRRWDPCGAIASASRDRAFWRCWACADDSRSEYGLIKKTSSSRPSVKKWFVHYKSGKDDCILTLIVDAWTLLVTPIHMGWGNVYLLIHFIVTLMMPFDPF